MARCAWCGVENDSLSRFCKMCGKEIDRGTIPGKCVRCGALNAFGVTKCESCGTPLADESQEFRPRDMPQGSCRLCGRPAVPGGDECPECSQRMYGRPLSPLASTRGGPSGGLLIAAILLIIAGALALLQGVILVASSGSRVFDPGLSETLSYSFCGMLDVLFGLGAIAGGYFAIRRTNFMLVVIGCLLALCSFGLLVGSLLGFIALIIVAVSKGEFD